MLSREERQMYLWLAENWDDEDNALIDLGAFVGGASASMAEGRRRAGRTGRVHAYDRFGAGEQLKEAFLYPLGVAPFDGVDILPLAQRLLSPWAPNVQFHKGDIEDQTWRGGTISVLGIDAAKSPGALDRIAEIFYPSLIPGRSIIVQQDFLHWKVPWIAAHMQRMLHWFRPVACCPGNSVLFLCQVLVDHHALEAGRVAALDDTCFLRDLRAMRSTLSGFGIDRRVAKLAESMALNPGMRRSRDFHVRPP